VAVLPLPPERLEQPLPETDLQIKFQCGHGPGGQHQNKTASAVRMTHKPTGLQVFITGRDQHANRREALRILTARVRQAENEAQEAAYGQARRQQLGSGKRGAKVRTWNFIASRLVDHRLGRKTNRIEDVVRGKLDLFLEGQLN